MSVVTDAELVLAARGAEPGAYRQLFERWHDRCLDLARNVVQDQEVAADVARDAFVEGRGKLSELRDPGGFGGWILRITRNQALDRLRLDTRPAGPAVDRLGPRTSADGEADPDAGPAEWVEAHHLLRLVTDALGARDVSLLDLHLRHGLEPAEIAEELQITTPQAGQLLSWLRDRLQDTIGAALLWREGDPACAVLATVSPIRFDATSAAAIGRHQRRCGACSAELRRHPNLEQLFVTIPWAVAPVRVKTLTVHALFDPGVPVVTADNAAQPAAPSAGGRRESRVRVGLGSPRPVGELVHAVWARGAARPLLAAGAFMVAVLVGVAVPLLTPGSGPDGSGGQPVILGAPVSAAAPSLPAPVVSRPAATPTLRTRSTRRSTPTKRTSASRSTAPAVPTRTAAPATPIGRLPTSRTPVRPDPWGPSIPSYPPPGIGGFPAAFQFPVGVPGSAICPLCFGPAALPGWLGRPV